MRLTLHQRCCNCWIAVGLWCGLVQIAALANPAAGPSVPAPPPTTTTTPPTLSPSSTPVLGVLRQSNPFDTDRKLWPDRTPVPPPPPPPPVPAPITDDDLEIYGVVSVGSVQKALLKLGKRFSNVPVGPTGLASVSVGSVVGEFVLAKVEPDQILLQAPGGQQWVRFSIKKERIGKNHNTAGGTPNNTLAPPIATNLPPSIANTAPIAPPFQPSGSPATTSNTPTSDTASNNAAATSTPPPTAGSLAAAIAAAQAAQTAAGAGVTPSIPPGMNPFEALLKQQQQGR